MMNVIITNNTIEYSNFIKVNTLAEVLSVKGEIDFLVYHKSNESSDDKVKYLSQLKGIVKTLIYIRGKDKIEQAVQMIVVGSGGKYFEDEFFLENSSELNGLIGSLDTVISITELGGVNVLNDFLTRFLREGKSNFNKAYLSVVEDAVSSMMVEYNKKGLELLQLSETATELFTHSADIISKIESEREKLKDLVSALEKAKENGDFVSKGSLSSIPNIMFFPKISYLKERSIIRIKELGNCSCLTSFMLGFSLFLARVKFTKPKIIFIYPVGKQYEDLYKDYTWITQNTNSTEEVLRKDIVFVNFPNKEVISKLLDDPSHNVFIVVDRMKANEEHILNSKGSAIKYCVSGNNVADKYSIKQVNRFSMGSNVKGLFNMKLNQDYPIEREQREHYYLDNCANAYDILYDVKRS